MGGGVVSSGGDLNVVVLSRDEQKAISTDRAQFVAELCMNFEDISVRKTTVAELPETVCEHLAATAQAFTQFAATCSDAEAIQRMLRKSEDFNLSDAITERRQTMMNDFVESVAKRVMENNPNPGIVRHEARDKFMRQLRAALDVAMSKHDQVR